MTTGHETAAARPHPGDDLADDRVGTDDVVPPIVEVDGPNAAVVTSKPDGDATTVGAPPIADGRSP